MALAAGVGHRRCMCRVYIRVANTLAVPTSKNGFLFFLI